MKAPTKNPSSGVPAIDATPKAGEQARTLNIGHILEIAQTSVDVAKGVIDYGKELEVTKRVRQEGETQVTLGRMDLEKAELDHQVQMKALSNEDKNSFQNHEQAMERLRHEARHMDQTNARQQDILKKLDEGKISAEEAVQLLNSKLS